MCTNPYIRIEFQNLLYQNKKGGISKKALIYPGWNYNWNYENVLYKKYIKAINTGDIKVMPIGCGQCMECRLTRAKKKATQAVLEAIQHEENYFITLTYDNEHLPKNKSITSPKTGITYYNDGTWGGTLKHKDFQNFMKKLRKRINKIYGVQIRDMMCGEYGKNGTNRPHYHAIIYGLPLEKKDCKELFKNDHNQPIYKVQWLQDLWGKGIVTVGMCTWNSCNYVARYVTKKYTGEMAEEEYYKKGKIPEYTTSSNRPGLGYEYFQENYDKIYNTDEIILHDMKGKAIKYKPPRYFDTLYDRYMPEEMEQIKNHRQEIAKLIQKEKNKNTDATMKQQYDIREETLNSKNMALMRNYENKNYHIKIVAAPQQ